MKALKFLFCCLILVFFLLPGKSAGSTKVVNATPNSVINCVTNRAMVTNSIIDQNQIKIKFTSYSSQLNLLITCGRDLFALEIKPTSQGLHTCIDILLDCKSGAIGSGGGNKTVVVVRKSGVKVEKNLFENNLMLSPAVLTALVKEQNWTLSDPAVESQMMGYLVQANDSKAILNYMNLRRSEEIAVLPRGANQAQIQAKSRELLDVYLTRYPDLNRMENGALQSNLKRNYGILDKPNQKRN